MDHKYEEALERARKGMPIDEIFPELKESEDERIRTRLIALVEAFGQGKYKDEMLAYLEKQKDSPMPEDTVIFQKGVAEGRRLEREEQKPAEWSEEDEFFRQQLIVYCEKCVQDTLATKCVDWLKSLRPQPHWKPSEEQVGILAKVFAGCNLNTPERDSMVDLFYNLKKMI